MTRRKMLLPGHVVELLEVLERSLTPLQIPYAIGGGVALNAHGYRRHTDDVDVFIREEDRALVLRALRVAGLVTATVMSPFMYMAKFPDETDPEIRIDVMVPAGDPEISAIEMAVRTELPEMGSEIPLFDPEWLALSKFYSNLPEHRRDLQKMWELGLFDVREARRRLGLMDPDSAPDFDAELRSFERKDSGRNRPKRPR